MWNSELKIRKLFNGNIVSYKQHDIIGNTLDIECFITQYKYFFAQLKNPELNLNITPNGVSGIIIDVNGNTLIAVRQNVTEYEGCYEFIPAGSIDASKTKNDFILFTDQLIEEFEEETQLKKESIEKIEPFCFIFDKHHMVYDICSKIYTKGCIDDLLKTEQSKEYKNIAIMSLENIHSKIEQNNCVPTSTVMLNNLD